MRKSNSISPFVSTLLLAGAFTIGAQTQPKLTLGPAPPSSAAWDYHLSPGDLIEIRLFFNSELNDNVQIRPDGRVSLQLIGDVPLSGLTLRQATDVLNRAYLKEVITPSVSIQVRGYGAQKVFVTGEVHKPGVINIPGPMTVYDAISEAGGVKHTGSTNAVVLFRKGPEGKPLERKLSLYRSGHLTEEANMLLTPFDVVVVPESKVARTARWVDQHIRQMIPVTATIGFAYLLQGPAVVY
jgi:protein involved in polysaccharide export with SLBB domain